MARRKGGSSLLGSINDDVNREEMIVLEPQPVVEEQQAETMQAAEIKLAQATSSKPDFERIARVLWMYLEEMDQADKENYRDSSIVHGIARNVAARRLKWAQRVNGTIVWKKQ